jgi:hypothetical protein
MQSTISSANSFVFLGASALARWLLVCHVVRPGYELKKSCILHTPRLRTI